LRRIHPGSTLSFFLYAVYASKANGVGAIKTNGISKNLVFSKGRLVRAATTAREERIGNFIVKKENVSPATLNLMVIDARRQGKRIGQVLVEKGVLSDDALQELLLLQNEQILIDILKTSSAGQKQSYQKIMTACSSISPGKTLTR